MNKKRFLVLSGAALAVLVLAGTIGAAAVFAQDPTPPADTPFPFRGRGSGWGFGGRGFFRLGDRWTMFDTIAEALGLTPVELFTEPHAGNSLEDIAAEQGVDMEDLQEAFQATIEAGGGMPGGGRPGGAGRGAVNVLIGPLVELLTERAAERPAARREIGPAWA